MRTRTFKSGNSQAVRLPGDTAFPENTEVEVTRTGNVVTIYPAPSGNLREAIEILRRMPRPAGHQPIPRTQPRKTKWD
jgi:antitoxin VapB